MSNPESFEFLSPIFSKKNIFTRFIRYIFDRKTFLYPDSAKDGLNYWQERVLFAVFASAMALSLLALIPAVYLALTKKLWVMLIADISAFILLVAMLISRHIGLRIQTIILPLSFYIIGAVIISQLGFLSGGPIWLFSFSVLAAVLSGLRAALAATLISAFTLIPLAWLVYSGQPMEREFLSSFSRSITAWANFVFLNAVVTVSVAVLVNGLQALNRKTAAASAALLEEKSALLKARESLTNEIVERKRIALDLERARDAAEVANRAKDEFLANMSHELRTPLHHIMGFTELVMAKHLGELRPEQEECLNYALQSSRDLLSLIEEILDQSNLEAGTMTLSLSMVVLRSLVDDSLVIFREKAFKHGIRLITEIPDQPESFPADERKLKQILNNLLSNAIKFTPEGGTIQVRIAPCQ